MRPDFMRRFMFVVATVATVAATALEVQAQGTTPVTRAQQRAAAGDSAAARAILDSVITSNTDSTTPRDEATYWLARFAASPTERERRLTSLIIDFPFSLRSGSALFELGMLELGRGDRDRAATHLSRFLSTNPVDSNRTAGSLALGRLLFDRGENARACAVLLAGRAELPPTAIETRNQFEFAVAPCRGVDTNATAPVDSSATAKSVIGEYTVQVAAYDAKTQADRLVTRLHAQNIEARVIGTKKPFRVRVGHFVTRPEAEAEAKRIGILLNTKPFVVMVGTEEM